ALRTRRGSAVGARIRDEDLNQPLAATLVARTPCARRRHGVRFHRILETAASSPSHSAASLWSCTVAGFGSRARSGPGRPFRSRYRSSGDRLTIPPSLLRREDSVVE